MDLFAVAVLFFFKVFSVTEGVDCAEVLFRLLIWETGDISGSDWVQEREEENDVEGWGEGKLKEDCTVMEFDSGGVGSWREREDSPQACEEEFTIVGEEVQGAAVVLGIGLTEFNSWNAYMKNYDIYFITILRKFFIKQVTKLFVAL